MLEDSIMDQVLPGVVEIADHFTCILSNGSYVRVPLQVVPEFMHV